MKNLILLCITLCTITIHARTLDEELSALYQKKPYLLNQSLTHAPNIIHTDNTQQQASVDTAKLNRYAGVVGLTYALALIGHEGYTLYTQTPNSHMWLNPLYALGNWYKGSSFFLYATQVAIEAICLKTAVYFVLLSYYGDAFDVVEHGAKKVKNIFRAIF